MRCILIVVRRSSGYVWRELQNCTYAVINIHHYVHESLLSEGSSRESVDRGRMTKSGLALIEDIV
jgi:hypothetical protein